MCLAVDHVVCFEQTGSEETKVNKEIMCWPFVVNGVLKNKAEFSRKWIPWAIALKSFFYVTYLIWNCFIWIYMEI